MNQPTLWELSQDLLSLASLISDIQEAEGIDEEEKQSHIEVAMQDYLGSDQSFDDKACKVAAYIKHLEALSEARKQEYRRIQQLSQQAEKQADSLKKYLSDTMRRVGKQKVSGVLANLSLRKKPPQLILGCEPEELPEDCKKIEVSPRLSVIREHLKANPGWPYAELVDKGEYSLIIK